MFSRAHIPNETINKHSHAGQSNFNYGSRRQAQFQIRKAQSILGLQTGLGPCVTTHRQTAAQPPGPRTDLRIRRSMRLRYVEPESTVTDAIRQRRGGDLNELDRTLLHSLPIAAGWNGLLGAVRTQTSYSPAIRELVICRVAALNCAWYEWKHHYPLALEAGIDEHLLRLVKRGRDWDLSGMEDLANGTFRWTVLRYVDCMTVDIKVPKQVFDDLRLWCTEQETVELTGTIAAYNMVSRFLVALDVGEMDKAGIP